jgi:flagellar operon protein
MEDMRLNYYTPVTTGVPRLSPEPLRQPQKETGSVAGGSFREALEAQLQKNSAVAFSRHAVNRVLQHNLELTEERIARLNEGVRLAEEKKLSDPLILVDRTAFLVNIKHHKVVTTVDANDLNGNVFTNIDGTVII